LRTISFRVSAEGRRTHCVNSQISVLRPESFHLPQSYLPAAVNRAEPLSVIRIIDYFPPVDGESKVFSVFQLVFASVAADAICRIGFFYIAEAFF